MTSVTNTLPPGLTQAQPVGATGGKNDLNQAAFLKLMTAQLKFQDPFDPVDNSAMVAQMAQFSSVAGIAEMNASLKAIATGMAGSRLSEAAGFIGRSVLVPGNLAMADADGSYVGEIAFANPADNVTLDWVDASGAVVHSQSLGRVEAGSRPVGFNSVDDDGKPLNLGPLKMRISGAAPSDMAGWMPVVAVESDPSSSEAMLVTPYGGVPVSDVRRIS